MRPCRPLAELVADAPAASGAGPDIALFEPDPRRFAEALLGAWRAGRRVWLAPDQQPATLASLRQSMAQWPSTPGPAEPPLVLFTSGSTGAPQPIGKTFRQLDAEIAALEATFGGRLGNAGIRGTVSHQHIYGLLFRVLWPLATGRAFDAPRIDFPANGRRRPAKATCS